MYSERKRLRGNKFTPFVTPRKLGQKSDRRQGKVGIYLSFWDDNLCVESLSVSHPKNKTLYNKTPTVQLFIVNLYYGILQTRT